MSLIQPGSRPVWSACAEEARPCSVGLWQARDKLLTYQVSSVKTAVKAEPTQAQAGRQAERVQGGDGQAAAAGRGHAAEQVVH